MADAAPSDPDRAAWRPPGGYARYTYPDGCTKCSFPYLDGAYHRCPYDVPPWLWTPCSRCGEGMAPMQYHRCGLSPADTDVQLPPAPPDIIEWMAGWRETE